MSRLPYAKSIEDSQEIMDFWSQLGGKVIRHDKGIERCFMLWFVCIGKEFVGVLSVQGVTCTMEASLESSESTDSSPSAQFIEMNIREIKKC